MSAGTSAAPAAGSAYAAATTPLMQQYYEIKARHQDAILFFRMGDFYETFAEDAVEAARVLGITLTTRNNGGAGDVPLAGVPVKAAADYVRKLVARGYRVAICEQVEDPKLAKGLVRREVIETVTPGAAFHDDLLDTARNTFCCAVVPAATAHGPGVAVAAADLSTGEFRLAVAARGDADALLARLAPREVLVVAGAAATARRARSTRCASPTARSSPSARRGSSTPRSPPTTSPASSPCTGLAGLGIGADDAPAVGAAGALLRYLRELQPGGLPHLARPSSSARAARCRSTR
jgi:DNA mismatch repair protein MutS